MKQKLLTTMFVVTCLASSSFAQTRQVSGKVTSSDGMPISAASISVVGTTTATQTDASGNFKLMVPSGATINVSSIGFNTQRVIVGNSTTLSIVLAPQENTIDDVVVTAMGIKRSEKSLGYSATTIGGDDLAESRNTNVVNAIAGKVAGVTVNSSGPSPGAAASITIRGYGSVTGSNEPLYVVDGVPIQTSTFNTQGTSIQAGGISNIASDDIESMTILKGAAATALYGSRAANGVVLVTTKTGKQGNNRNFSIAYNGGMQFRQLSVFPLMQNSFGQGWNGQQTFIENGSWGPRLDGSLQLIGPVWNNQQLLHTYTAQKNNVKDFFDIGTSLSNSVSFSGVSSDNKMNYYLSYSNVSDDGVMPSDADSYKRNTIAYRSSYQAQDWLKISSNVNFSTSKTDVAGSYAGTSVIDGLLELPRDVSIVDKKDLNSPFNTPEAYFTPYGVTNPYWALANNYNRLNSKQINGKLQVDIKPIKEVNFTYRFGFDHIDYDRKVGTPQIKNNDDIINNNYGYPYSNMDQSGSVATSYGRNYELNHDFLATYENQFNKFSFTGMLGVNLNERYFTSMNGTTDNLAIYTGFWQLSNGATRTALGESQSKRRLIGVFGDVSVGYEETYFLNFTARNDWSSTLPIGNNNYFYPGATLSYIFTNHIPKNQILNFGKVRLAYGRTGSDANVYQTSANYVQAFANGYYGSNIAAFPLNNTNSFLLSTQKGSNTLKPEMNTEFEAGLNLKFLNSRIGLDIAYYNRTRTDQIFPLSIDPATGFATVVTNVGDVRNRGVEILLNTTPVRTDKFRWDLDFNFTVNKNKVVSLPEELGGRFQINNFSAGNAAVNMYAEVGQPLGTFYTYLPRYVEDTSSPNYGNIIVDANGFPKLTSGVESTGKNIQSKWVGGVTTAFSAYNFTLSATLDVREGGYMFSRTKNIMQFTGNGIGTMYNDRNPFVIPNSVYEDSNGQLSENSTPIKLSNSSLQDYWNKTGGVDGGEYYLLDRSFRKIRNISLTYNFPKTWVHSMKLSDIAISGFVNNPFVWTPKSNRYIDPEGSTDGTGLMGQFGELYINPASRVYGFNLSLRF